MAMASIIIRTAGQRPQGLARALSSALAQTYRPLEVVMVTDGISILPRMPTPPEGVILRHLPAPRRGRSAAGNAGLEAAAGEIIGFLDDDDWLCPDHITTLAQALETHPTAGASYGLAEEVAVTVGDRETGRRIVGSIPFSLGRLWLGNFLPIQAVLFRRRLFIELGGFNEDLDALEDWDLWLRYAGSAAFIGVGSVTSAYTIPAECVRLAARAATHAPALAAVCSGHALDRAMFSFDEIRTLQNSILERLDDFAGARWCLGRLWRRLRTGR